MSSESTTASACSGAANTTAYENYEVWKGWDNLFTHTASDAAYFAAECSGAKIANGSVLEIGFGAGSFLSWAKSQNAEVNGIEVNPKLIEAASAEGINILPANFETVADNYKNHFDTIVAFDVFEHFTLEEISNRMKAAMTLIKPGGTFILRFPNGQSPLGLGPQHGDLTHLTPLSKDKLEPYIRRDGWEILRYDDAAIAGSGGLLRRIKRGFRLFFMRLISKITRFLYAIVHPWGPVVTLVLKAPEAQQNSVPN